MSQPHITTLTLTNFRAFRELHIERLGHVNLIAGQNNVGKTCLLEALWLYASGGSPQVLRKLLAARNELPVDSETAPITAASYLMYGRKPLEDVDISITSATDVSLEIRAQQLDTGLINLVCEQSDRHPVNEVLNLIARYGLNHPDSEAVLQRWIASFARQPVRAYLMRQKTTVLAVRFTEYARLIGRDLDTLVTTTPPPPTLPHSFRPSVGVSETDIYDLWDRVYLTPQEDDVLTALRIIQPDIERIGLVESQGPAKKHIPMVRVKGLASPIPLSSLGEGMNRLFGMALILVNARDGVLLVDEIENGIYHGAQAELWRFIFEMAARLNIQVFATTHSWDAVTAFQRAACAQPELRGELISLRADQRAPGRVVGVLFDESELAIAARERIEVR